MLKSSVLGNENPERFILISLAFSVMSFSIHFARLSLSTAYVLLLKMKYWNLLSSSTESYRYWKIRKIPYLYLKQKYVFGFTLFQKGNKGNFWQSLLNCLSMVLICLKWYRVVISFIRTKCSCLCIIKSRTLTLLQKHGEPKKSEVKALNVTL